MVPQIYLVTNLFNKVLTECFFFLQNITSITGFPTDHRKDPGTVAFASITKWTLWLAEQPDTSDWPPGSFSHSCHVSSRSGWTRMKSRTASARTDPFVYCTKPIRPSHTLPLASEYHRCTVRQTAANTASWWEAARVHLKTTWWRCLVEHRWHHLTTATLTPPRVTISWHFKAFI